MKYYILVLIALISLSSCSEDDDVPNQHFEEIGITEVEIPSEFIYGDTYEIIVSYTFPNSCYSFYNFDYIHDETSREIYTYAIVNDDDACLQTNLNGEYTVSIEVRQQETYIFKFWQGRDNQGNNEYLTIEVPVI